MLYAYRRNVFGGCFYSLIHSNNNYVFPYLQGYHLFTLVIVIYLLRSLFCNFLSFSSCFMLWTFSHLNEWRFILSLSISVSRLSFLHPCLSFYLVVLSFQPDPLQLSALPPLSLSHWYLLHSVTVPSFPLFSIPHTSIYLLYFQSINHTPHLPPSSWDSSSLESKCTLSAHCVVTVLCICYVAELVESDNHLLGSLSCMWERFKRFEVGRFKEHG